MRVIFICTKWKSGIKGDKNDAVAVFGSPRRLEFDQRLATNPLLADGCSNECFLKISALMR